MKNNNKVVKRKVFSSYSSPDYYYEYLTLDLEKLNRVVNKMDWYSVYWLKLKDIHTDVFHEGYVGVTADVKNRLLGHILDCANSNLEQALKLYGIDAFECVILHSNVNSYSAYNIEYGYRPYAGIGYNIYPGGNLHSRLVCCPYRPYTLTRQDIAKLKSNRSKSLDFVLEGVFEKWLQS